MWKNFLTLWLYADVEMEMFAEKPGKSKPLEKVKSVRESVSGKFVKFVTLQCIAQHSWKFKYCVAPSYTQIGIFQLQKISLIYL